MQLIISNQHNEIISSGHTDSPLTASVYKEFAYQSSEPFWQSTAREIHYPGTHIAMHEVNVLQSVNVQTLDAPQTVSLFFVENGSLVSKAGKQTRDWQISSLQHNLLYSAYSTDATFFEEQKNLRLNIISFTPKRFAELTEGAGKITDHVNNQIAKGNSSSLSEQRNLRINLSMMRLFRDLKDSSFHPSARKLHVESKVLELLALQCNQLAQETDETNNYKLTPRDIQKLNEVRDYLLNDIAYSPGLSELSRHSGLNMFKLKSGFKQLFNQTIFGFLRERRLEHAMDQLKNRDKALTDIAYESGFASLAHFSDAFRKKYGSPPGKWRNH
ncbi:MAG: helix-turn-helix transcriptional regulator [Terrimonas ferruginea]|jgi:AraC family transcriptional activator of pyochelin receptor|uniref:helix-turn-helix transcriptional regulator n=1 Tax=Terrimonas ferruginea TaxID=249 RepID=UPI000928C2C4|nr:AraC family transcriptional regulator [Terrimonas ferruginea]MBN8784408.1 helix-turn-helix transcriptional regulator [Terrimonas ferruginea]OJW45833.1 MAG: hypothetical protein BGO56_01355 [Sphingobacteriales bacterium 48-107]